MGAASFPPRAPGRRSIRREDTPPASRAPRSTTFGHVSFTPLTRRVLQELGIDASGLRAQGIRLFLGKVPIRYAVVVCERANRSCPKVYPFAARTLYWPLEDPAEAEGSREDRLAVFRRVRDEIAGRVLATNSKAVRRIHQVCCRLDDIATGRRQS